MQQFIIYKGSPPYELLVHATLYKHISWTFQLHVFITGPLDNVLWLF